MVETVISVFLVGLLMVASLQSRAAATRRESDAVNRVRARQLAGALMNEILQQEFDEGPTFGPEPGEATGNRSLFDDVDDYVGWSKSPPDDRAGTTLPGFAGWTCGVAVQWADSATLAPTAATRTGLKRITVTVSKGGKTWASVVGYRSIAWTDTIPSPSDTTGNHPPAALATSPGLNKRVGNTLTFDGSTSSDQDGDYLSYVWSFGDGTTGSGKTVTKIYSAPGNYTCTLTVYDGRGGVGTAVLSPVINP